MREGGWAREGKKVRAARRQRKERRARKQRRGYLVIVVVLVVGVDGEAREPGDRLGDDLVLDGLPDLKVVLRAGEETREA